MCYPLYLNLSVYYDPLLLQFIVYFSTPLSYITTAISYLLKLQLKPHIDRLLLAVCNSLCPHSRSCQCTHTLSLHLFLAEVHNIRRLTPHQQVETTGLRVGVIHTWWLLADDMYLIDGYEIMILSMLENTSFKKTNILIQEDLNLMTVNYHVTESQSCKNKPAVNN